MIATELVYVIKFISITMLILFMYGINARAQEKNEILPLNFEKSTHNIKNYDSEFIEPTLNLQLENSMLTSKSYLLEKINYSRFSINNLDHLSVFSTSSDYNYGFEGAASVGLGVNWNINDKLTLTGNPFLTSYYFGPMDYNRSISVGSNAVLAYRANDWLTLRVFGQYAYNGLNDPYATSLIAPQNSFGGEVFIKFSDVFGLGGGIRYINNKGKWTPQFYTLPLIKINATKLLKRD